MPKKEFLFLHKHDRISSNAWSSPEISRSLTPHAPRRSIKTADGQPRTASLWRSVPPQPTALAAVRGGVVGNRARIVPGTLAGQKGQQNPQWAECRPRLPDQKAPSAAHALPTGRGSSGFRNVLCPRANARTKCWSGQPCRVGPRRATRRRASAPGSAHHSQGRGNQCALLVSGRASRLPAIQSLTVRTSVAARES